MVMQINKILDLAEAALVEVRDGKPGSALHRFDGVRAQLTPKVVGQLDAPLRWMFREVFWGWRGPKPWFRPAPLPRDHLQSAMERERRLATLCLHAGDGFVRQHALGVVSPTDTAARASLLLRCNDWVAQVREDATAMLGLYALNWDEEVLFPLVIFVLEKADVWGRGGSEALKVLLEHPHWDKAVMRALLAQTQGPLARRLLHILKRDDDQIDLPRLAADARSTFVRAVAVQALLDGRVIWPSHREYVWLDRVHDRKQLVQRFGQRNIPVAPTAQMCVFERAARDKSAVVRKLAADHVIRVGPGASPTMAQRLEEDKSPAVRERIDFAKRKWSGQVTVLNEVGGESAARMRR